MCDGISVVMEDQLPDLIRQLVREREALLADLREADRVDCCHCAYYIPAGTCASMCDDVDLDCALCKGACPCKNCVDMSNWKWRGLGAPENDAGRSATDD